MSNVGFSKLRILNISYSWFSLDVTKIRTKELSILLAFYFHEVSEKLKTSIFTNFHFEGFLCFVIEYPRISNSIHVAAERASCHVG